MMTDNIIRDEEIMIMREKLKKNTTLTSLNVDSKKKMNITNKKFSIDKL